MCSSQEVVKIILIFTIFLEAIFISKKTIRNSFIINILFKQTPTETPTDIILFHDRTGLDMNLEEWKEFCRRAWENDYEYLHIDRFAKIRKCRYTNGNCNKKTYIECTPEMKLFYFSYINMI